MISYLYIKVQKSTTYGIKIKALKVFNEEIFRGKTRFFLLLLGLAEEKFS